MSEVRRNVMYALFAAILVVSKELLAFLPNVELVTFLLMVFAINFRLRGTIFIATIFCFLQIMLYGFDIWSIMYFIVWNSYVLITYTLRNYLCNSYHKMALLSLVFGLIFGFLFSIPYFMMSFKMGWVGFLQGIVFDVVHGVANYIIMIILFDKINEVVKQLSKKYRL